MKAWIATKSTRGILLTKNQINVRIHQIIYCVREAGLPDRKREKEENKMYSCSMIKAGAAAIVLLLAACRGSEAEGWVDVTWGLGGGEEIACIEAEDNSDTIYAGTSRGLYVSRDHGSTWSREDVSALAPSVTGIALSGHSIFAASEEGLFVREGEKGLWKRIQGENGIKGVCVREGAFGVIAWTDKHVFSVENGTWRDITPGLLTEEISKVVVVSDVLYAAHGGEVLSGRPEAGEWESVRLISRAEEARSEEENSDELDEDDTLKNKAIRDLTPAEKGGVMAVTGKGIYVLEGSSRLDRIDTTGLPSEDVLAAVFTERAVFAATGRKVFLREPHAHNWVPVLEVSDGGDIREMKVHRDSGGKERVLLVFSKRIYTSDLSREMFRSLKTDGVEAILAENFAAGPDIREVHRMAIEYAEVSPDKIAGWRKAAGLRGILPRLAVKYDENYSDKVEFYKSASTTYMVEGPRDRRDGWGLTLTWDLADLIWNSSQTSIDVRSKLMVQLRDDILENVTRLYFERKRLVGETSMGKNNADGKYHSAVARIEELTAYLDAYTGGMFSDSLACSETHEAGC